MCISLGVFTMSNCTVIATILTTSSSVNWNNIEHPSSSYSKLKISPYVVYVGFPAHARKRKPLWKYSRVQSEGKRKSDEWVNEVLENIFSEIQSISAFFKKKTSLERRRFYLQVAIFNFLYFVHENGSRILNIVEKSLKRFSKKTFLKNW